jgi:hypothetical protein
MSEEESVVYGLFGEGKRWEDQDSGVYSQDAVRDEFRNHLFASEKQESPASNKDEKTNTCF